MRLIQDEQVMMQLAPNIYNSSDAENACDGQLYECVRCRMMAFSIQSRAQKVIDIYPLSDCTPSGETGQTNEKFYSITDNTLVIRLPEEASDIKAAAKDVKICVQFKIDFS